MDRARGELESLQGKEKTRRKVRREPEESLGTFPRRWNRLTTPDKKGNLRRLCKAPRSRSSRTSEFRVRSMEDVTERRHHPQHKSYSERRSGLQMGQFWEQLLGKNAINAAKDAEEGVFAYS